MARPASTVIVIPTFNEVENIQRAIVSVHEFLGDADVLVVDDSSPDGTGVLADELAKGDSRVHVLHRGEKDGLGAAYLAGFNWAFERGYEIIGEFDADGSHPASALPALRSALSATPSAGLAIGSRWTPGGSVANWPKSRELLSRGGNAYARLMLNVEVRDITAGFRLYRSGLLRSMCLDSVTSKGYCFQVDLTIRALAARAQVVEVPIQFQERVLGVSKMSRSIVLEAMAMVTVWGLARILGEPGAKIASHFGVPVVNLTKPSPGL